MGLERPACQGRAGWIRLKKGEKLPIGEGALSVYADLPYANVRRASWQTASPEMG